MDEIEHGSNRRFELGFCQKDDTVHMKGPFYLLF